MLSNDKIKIWGYCTIIVDIFTKTSFLVNQKYFRTISASANSVGYTACDAFQTLSWSACCVLITLRLVRTRRSQESTCSAFMPFGATWNVLIFYKTLTVHCTLSRYVCIFEVKNSIAIWCKRVARHHRVTNSLRPTSGKMTNMLWFLYLSKLSSMYFR